jgi:tripartite-type tricarboxylate transporter receptor subunit TctC
MVGAGFRVGTRAAVALLALAAFTGSVRAQAYPSKPVRMLIGQPPGGVQDTLARAMANELSKAWGQPVTLDNRVGGTGLLAGITAAKAAPDGYTLFFSTATNMNTAQFLQKDAPYHPEKDFIPVVGLGQSFSVLIAGNHLGVSTTQEFVEKAKANPGKLNYGTFGVASASHFDTESLAREAGFKAVHIPYKGAVDVMTGLMGGQVDFAITALTAAIPLINSGKIKGLGYTGDKRAPSLPQVPTLKEQGYGNFETGGLFALYVRTGTAQAVIDKIAADASRIRETPEFQKKVLEANGMENLPLAGAALVKRFDYSRVEFQKRISGLDLQLNNAR